MDQQGAGRIRRAADARRQPTWPPPEGAPGDSAFSGPTGPLPGRVRQPGASPGTGPSRVLGPGTGPQRLIDSGTGTGTGPVFPPGTGARPAFPPGPGVPPGTGGQSAVAPGTGAHRTLGPGPGPGRLAGSGPHPVLGSAYAAAPTPPAGFPAAGPPGGSFGGQAPGGSPGGSFSEWHAPAEPLADPAAADTADIYRSDDTFTFDPKAADRAAQPAGPPADRRRGDRNRRRFQPRIAWVAAAAVIAAAAGFAGWKYLYEARVNAPVPSTLRLPTTAPTDNGLDKNLGRWQHIGSRSQDPQPLTLAALYPPQFELNGKSYTRTAASITKTCSLAVFGADLQAALQTGHCSQVARASYLSGDGKMMGTVGVVNLISVNAAQKAGQATSTQEILAPLTSKKGPTSKLGNGTGVVQAEIKGHYLILVYAEYANLKSPSGTDQRQALEQFATNIITGSANINLSTRMLTGKQ